MTSKVTIQAHCPADKSVEVTVNGEIYCYLDDGQEYVEYIYDNRSVAAREVANVRASNQSD